MAAIERDPLLTRIERNAVLACVAMAVVAALVTGDRVAGASGVIAGGALAAISYRGIKDGIDAVVAATAGGERRRITVAFGLVKFFTRYAILAAAAYLIMARLRLPPVAVIAGASSIVVAVTLEALHVWRNSNTRSGSFKP